MNYQGQTSKGDEVELRFADDHGSIMISLPRDGINVLCGRDLTESEFETVVLAHEKELHPLIDRACKRQGGYVTAYWESGASFRRLNISLDDIKGSGIQLSTTVLDLAEKAQFVRPPL
jgi:hypothetical protein